MTLSPRSLFRPPQGIDPGDPAIASADLLLVDTAALEQFQEKCGAVSRPELRKNKERERFRDSGKNGNAPGASRPTGLAYLTLSARSDGDDEILLRKAVLIGAAGIALKDVRNGAEVQRLDVLLSVAEAEEGVEHGRTKILALTDGMLPPAGSSAGFSEKSRRLIGLAFDPAALAATLGATRERSPDGQWAPAFAQARTATLFSSKAAGLAAFDAPSPLAGEPLLMDCHISRADGFDGRLTADPQQVEIINAAYERS
ncbi:MAG: hypothetical protein QHC90_26945 [Shinella sp.]|nr:hypothetical protein [Shinella sp.]